MGRIVFFGATGYTGALAARAAVGNGVPVVLAGRRPEALRALATEIGADEVLEATADDDRLATYLHPDDVLVSTTGPFTALGDTAVDAAITAGATYLDCAGEGGFHRRVFEGADRRARDTGAALVTGVGADWVPGNLAGALALREAGLAASSLEIEYVITGESFEFSAGSTATGQLLMAHPAPPYALRDGHVIDVPFTSRECQVGDAVVVAHQASTTEPFTLPRIFPDVRTIDVFLSMPPASAPSTSGRGPTAGDRERNGQIITARVQDSAGQSVAGARVEAGNGYDYTAAVLAWGALEASRGNLTGTGALGPVEAFGIDPLLLLHARLGATVTTWGTDHRDPTTPSKEIPA